MGYLLIEFWIVYLQPKEILQVALLMTFFSWMITQPWMTWQSKGQCSGLLMPLEFLSLLTCWSLYLEHDCQLTSCLCEGLVKDAGRSVKSLFAKNVECFWIGLGGMVGYLHGHIMPHISIFQYLCPKQFISLPSDLYVCTSVTDNYSTEFIIRSWFGLKKIGQNSGVVTLLGWNIE